MLFPRKAHTAVVYIQWVAKPPFPVSITWILLPTTEGANGLPVITRQDANDDREGTMSETTLDTTMSHDELVARIAERAFDRSIFTVYTNTQRVLQRSVKGQYPHLVAVGKVDQQVEMVGMVETVESLHDLDAAARRWRSLEHLQAAMYLYVPRGYCTDARTLCLRQHIRISDFRHYWFEGDELHVARCFA
jgi:hypothetical protein